MRSISIPFFFIVALLLAFEFSSCGDGSTSPILTNVADSCGSAVDKSVTYPNSNFVIPSTYTL